MRHGRGRLLIGSLGFCALLLSQAGCPPMPPPNNNGNQNQNQNVNGNGNANVNGNVNANTPARFLTETRSTNIALTSDERKLVVVNADHNTVSVIQVRDASNNDVGIKLTEIGVGQEPHSVAIMPDDSRAYVTNSATGTVSVIDLQGSNIYEVIGEIPVGTEPRGCALTPNGRLLFVANHTNASVSVIDTATNAVTNTVTVQGAPQAIAITNNGDDNDNDETVFVTEFYAQLIPGGAGEARDDGKQGFVNAINVSGLATTRIALSPLANSGFTADRTNFCPQFNMGAAFDTFCPDVNAMNAQDPVIIQDPQAVFPNQLFAALIRNNRLFIPNIGAQPEPPIRFNVNVQALVHVVNTAARAEDTAAHVNINDQIKLETQPDPAVENTVLTRLFGGDMIAIDADQAGNNFVLLSRGGNYVMKATIRADGRLNLNIIPVGAGLVPANAVRFQTGNLPTGLVVTRDFTRCYTNNEISTSVTAINLQNNTVINRDIDSSEPPAPGTYEHGVRVGKLVFFTALGTPDNGIFETPLRDIVPLQSRNKASDNAWSSCASCHPFGWADGVTWIFATGPRQTIPLDSFFAKDNPLDQRISNWNAVRSSVTDFNENSVAVQGGKGFAGTPADPDVHNHGIDTGASDALDAQTLWVATIRPPILPRPNDGSAEARGRDLFVNNCASCHGGAKWTKSQVVYARNPAFNGNPVAQVNPGVPRDPGVTAAGGGQIVSYTSQGQVITFIDNVGTFDAMNPIEIRNNATLALGALGFNSPSLLSIAYHAPYLHHGQAQRLEEVFPLHALNGGTIATQLNSQQQQDLLVFLRSIDGSTVPPPNATDAFRDAISN